MKRFIGIGLIAYLDLTGRIPALHDSGSLLGQSEFIAGLLIALLLVPTIKRSFD